MLASMPADLKIPPMRDSNWLARLEPSPCLSPCDPWTPARVGYSDLAAHPDREAETWRVWEPTPLDEIRYEAYIHAAYGSSWRGKERQEDPYVGECR